MTLRRLLRREYKTFVWELEDGQEWRTTETWPLLAFWYGATVEVDA